MEHTNRTIRPLTQQDLEAYLDIYLNAYPAYKTLDEACREHYREKHRLELREDRQVQTVGLFEGDVLIATMKLILFSMNCFGRMQTACGLMALEVHPLHKKQGAALEMIRYFEDYARRHGALLTLLLPFQISFYRRMGYGFAGKLYEYHLPTAVLPKPDGEARRHLRLLQPEDFDRVLACHSRFAAQNHGMVEKFEEEVRAARTDVQVRRIGYCAEDGTLRGYVAYRFESASDTNYTRNRLSVEELVYDDGVVLRALLGALKLQEDLAQTVLLRTGEEDFHHLLEDPQDVSGNYIDYGFLQTNVSAIGTMFKILDPAAFVTATAYRALPQGTLTAAFCYRDAAGPPGLPHGAALRRRPLVRPPGGSTRRGNGDVPAGGSGIPADGLLRIGGHGAAGSRRRHRPLAAAGAASSLRPEAVAELRLLIPPFSLLSRLAHPAG